MMVMMTIRMAIIVIIIYSTLFIFRNICIKKICAFSNLKQLNIRCKLLYSEYTETERKKLISQYISITKIVNKLNITNV